MKKNLHPIRKALAMLLAIALLFTAVDFQNFAVSAGETENTASADRSVDSESAASADEADDTDDTAGGVSDVTGDETSDEGETLPSSGSGEDTSDGSETEQTTSSETNTEDKSETNLEEESEHTAEEATEEQVNNDDETGNETETESENESESAAASEGESESETETESETGTDLETENETELESEHESETETEDGFYETEVVTDEGIRVSVSAAAGVLPENARLVAEMIGTTDDDTTDTTDLEQTLDDHEVEYDGFIALDVHFEDEAGNELEPDGAVAVSFVLPEDLLPEDADMETLSVQHLTEDANGNVTDVETVAAVDLESAAAMNAESGTDGMENADIQECSSQITGTVSESEEEIIAEFTVNAFSTFTITFINGNYSLTVACIDETNGKLIEDYDDYKIYKVTSSSSYRVFGTYVILPEILGYEYDKAVVATSWETALSSPNKTVTSLRYYSKKWQATGGIQVVSEDDTSGTYHLYFLFQAKEETLTGTYESESEQTDDYDLAYQKLESTSEGITCSATYSSGNVCITFTIPEDYSKKSIVLNPRDVDGEDVLYETLRPQYTMNPGTSSGGVTITIKVENNSSYEYQYEEGSFVFAMPDSDDDMFLTGYMSGGTPEINIKRIGDAAISALLTAQMNDRPSGTGAATYMNQLLTDENIGNLLKLKGYTNGINDLYKYYIDFYNDTYGTKYTSLDEIPLDDFYDNITNTGSYKNYSSSVLETNTVLLQFLYDFFYHRSFKIKNALNDSSDYGYGLGQYVSGETAAVDYIESAASKAFEDLTDENDLNLRLFLDGYVTNNNYETVYYGLNFSFGLERDPSFTVDKEDEDTSEKLNSVSLTFEGVTDSDTEGWKLIWSRNADGIESYTILKEDTIVSTATGTKESPSVVIMGLPAGTYTLTAESEIPAGYASIEKNTYQLIIDDEGSLNTDSVDGNPISISGETVTVSDQKIKVVINKKDSEDKDLSGAKFTVTPVGNGTFADGTSDSIVVSGDGSNDLYGKLVGGCSYTVSETTVPDGYTQADDFILEVKEDGSVSVTSSASSAPPLTGDENISCRLNASTGVYEVKVVDDTFAVTVKKQSSTTDSVLGGAEFVLYQKAADDTWEAVTVKNSSDEDVSVTISTGSEDGLAVLDSFYENTAVMKINGTYRLVETKAADGYILPKDEDENNLYVEFTIKADGSIQATSNSTNFTNFTNLVTVDSEKNVITVKNEPISITLTKADGGYADETNTAGSVTGYLEGVSFTLSDQTSGYLENSKTAVTNESGQITFATDESGFQLIAGHTYELTEIPPTGYYGIGSVMVTVASDGTVSLTEAYSDSVYYTGVTAYGTQITVIDTRKKGTITVTKKAEDGETALPGVEFTLYKNETENTEGVVTTKTVTVGSLITNDSGTVTWNNLEWGTYTISETAAPAGYTLNSKEKTVTIDADSVASGHTVTYTDSALAFTIKKVDDTGAAIRGASFELSKVESAEARNEAKTVASTLALLTSGADGVLVWDGHSNAELMKLFQVGETYSLTEVMDYSTTALSYIAFTSVITFKVESDGSLILVSNEDNAAELSEDNLTLTITNTRTSFTLNKVDADDTTISLNDVSLTFTGKTGTVTEGWTLVWTRDEAGKESYTITYTDADTGEKELFSGTNDIAGAIAIKGLPVGTYTLTAESNIPEGYVSAVGTGYQLKMNSDGTVVYSTGSDDSEIMADSNLVTISDAKQSLTIKKTDADSTAIIGKTVVFSVTGVFAGDDTETTRYVTADGNSLSEAYRGQAISVLEDGDLVAGQTYVLTEVVAPDGYALPDGTAASVCFTVADNGAISEVMSENYNTDSDFTVTSTLSSDTRMYENVITMKDEPIAITLTAIDGLYDGTGTSVMGGISFTLVQLDEKGDAVDGTEQSTVTDSSGQISFGAAADDNTFAVVGG